MENLATLRSEVIQELLIACSSIKVNRLFIYMAKKVSHTWIEVETYWTSLAVSPCEAIDIYHQHGECEKYHLELKTDMDLERLPSEYFSTNAM